MRFRILAALMLIPASTRVERMIQAAGPTLGITAPSYTTLDALRNHYRPLLVFAPSYKDPRFTRQAHLIEGSTSELQDRQVLVIAVTATIRKKEDGSESEWKAVDQADLSARDAAAARQQFHVAPGDFFVVLIGKDGGEKFRTHTPVTIERLNAVIDAMPMRQQEVRNGNSK